MEIPEKPTPKYYTDAHRIAQQKYRAKNRDDYNKSQRELYTKLHQDEAWRKKFNEQSAKNNLAARQKKREEILQENPDHVFKKRGRPRKELPEEMRLEQNDMTNKRFILKDPELHRVQETIRSIQLKMDRLTEQMKQLIELQNQEKNNESDDEIAKADKTIRLSKCDILCSIHYGYCVPLFNV
jgi:hypothetical protein